MGHSLLEPRAQLARPWNAGRMVGAKHPPKPRDVWAIRFHLDEHQRLRDRESFDLAIGSKLRGYDVVKLKIGDVAADGTIRNHATVIQQKTGKPVQFELIKDVRESLLAWLNCRGGAVRDFPFFRAASTALAIQAPARMPA